MSKRIAFFIFSLPIMVLAWPHLFFKGQVPIDGNVVRLFYPNWTFLHAHPPTLTRWPLWNPYRNMGEPFLADPQSMAAYPPMWILCRLSRYLNFLRFWVLGHTLLAAYFMAKWVFRLTKDEAGAATAAAVIAFNGFFMAHASLPNHFAAAAYLPVVFYCFDSGSATGLALALALQWLAGFPPFSYLTGLVLLVWAFFSGSGERKLLGKSVWLALGLAALQLFPFVELFLQSSRSLLLNASIAGEFSEPWRQLCRMLFIPQWFSWRPQLAGDQAVVSFYVGPFTLLLAAWAVCKGEKKERLIVLGILLCFLLSLGTSLPFYSGLFFTRLLRFPANWLVLSSVGLALLSGIGISRLPLLRWKWMTAALVLADLLAFAQYVRVPWFDPAYLENAPPLAQMLEPSAKISRIYHSPVILDDLNRQRGIREIQDYTFLKESLTPSYGMAFGLREVESYQVLKLTRAADYQRRLAREGPSSPLLRWAGAATVITRKPGQDFWGPQNIQTISIAGMSPPLFFADPKRTGKTLISVYGPGNMEGKIWTAQESLLVFSEVSYPGWRVYVDGKRKTAELFQNTFLAVRIPPGQHEVAFRFVSFSFWAGLFISVVAVMTLWIC